MFNTIFNWQNVLTYTMSFFGPFVLKLGAAHIHVSSHAFTIQLAI